ncbi:MAG: F0F1 ATP synthase subunit B [bacterium]|nr:F0F1 ATP synthase subunit B [bacterium]
MNEFIHNFGIDWKLLLAQAINFTILLFLLKKFAFGPLMKMLKTRREEIEKGITLTRDAEITMKRVNEDREEVLLGARGEALGIIQKAEEDASEKRVGIVQGAEHQAEKMLDEAKRRLEEEKGKIKDEVYKDTRELVRAATVHVLGKMSASERDEKLIEEALKELKATYK